MIFQWIILIFQHEINGKSSFKYKIPELDGHTAVLGDVRRRDRHVVLGHELVVVFDLGVGLLDL